MVPRTLEISQDTFESHDKQLLSHCNRLLNRKRQQYASDRDRHHNFNQAARLRQKEVPDVLAGMMLKHTICLYDYIEQMSNSLQDFGVIGIPLPMLVEVFADHINYIRLLSAWCVEHSKTTELVGAHIPTEVDSAPAI